eukprot:gene7127-7932_t
MAMVEVRHASKFLRDFLRRHEYIAQEKLEKFSEIFEDLLFEKYKNHWHPNKPHKGSAYRCLRIAYSTMDPTIATAALRSGVSSQDLFRTLPAELTIWIDPNEVSYRIGEEGSICELFEASKEVQQPKTKEAKTKMASISSVSCRMEAPTLSRFNKVNDNLQECVSS